MGYSKPRLIAATAISIVAFLTILVCLFQLQWGGWAVVASLALGLPVSDRVAKALTGISPFKVLYA